MFKGAILIIMIGALSIMSGGYLGDVVINHDVSTNFSNGEIPNWLYAKNSTIYDGKLIQQSSTANNVNDTYLYVSNYRDWEGKLIFEIDHRYNSIYGLDEHISLSFIKYIIEFNDNISVEITISSGNLSNNSKYGITIIAHKEMINKEILEKLYSTNSIEYPYVIYLSMTYWKHNLKLSIYSKQINKVNYTVDMRSNLTKISLFSIGYKYLGVGGNGIAHPKYTYNITEISIKYIPQSYNNGKLKTESYIIIGVCIGTVIIIYGVVKKRWFKW